MPNLLKKQSVVDSRATWTGRWSRTAQREGGSMPEQMFRRGKEDRFYANCRFQGVYIRDCLGTSDWREAEKRLAELKYAVERGDYKAWKKSFKEVCVEYLEAKENQQYEYIIRLHLLPRFGNMLVGEINKLKVFDYFEDRKYLPESSLRKHLQVLRAVAVLAKRDFRIPEKLTYPNKGKRFDETQILEEDEVLKVADLIYDPYRVLCLIAIYSGLRLGDVIGLKKGTVDFKKGWLVMRQQKTGNPVSIPIHPKLKEAFQAVKVWPLNDDDRIFPDAKMRNVSQAAKKAFKKAGIPWGSFHHFRHFAACHLLNQGIDVSIVQKVLGHANIGTTMRYARVKRDTIKTAMESAFSDTNCTQKKVVDL